MRRTRERNAFHWEGIYWHVYQDSGGRTRVSSRELVHVGRSGKPGGLRPTEALAAVVANVPRCTVMKLLREGVAPCSLQRECGKMADAQASRQPVEPNRHVQVMAARRKKDEPKEAV